MAKKKKILDDRKQTTARIPKGLLKQVQIKCVSVECDQTEAINQGLILWLALHGPDKHLRLQLNEIIKNWKEPSEESYEEETTAAIPRRRFAR